VTARSLLRTLDEKVAPANAAVVVIDVQNDFVADGGWADRMGWDCSQNQKAAKRLVPFLEAARGAGVLVVFIRAIYDERYLSLPMVERNRRRGIDSTRCQTGSWGAEFYLVAPRPEEPIVVKHRLSAFVNTDLQQVLEHAGVQSLILTGVYTDGCVESTARHGYFLDYYTLIVDDCCATVTPERHRSTLERCDWDFGIVATADQITTSWLAIRAPG
jgi:ureidoacrylate peracid hydrolase